MFFTIFLDLGKDGDESRNLNSHGEDTPQTAISHNEDTLQTATSAKKRKKVKKSKKSNISENGNSVSEGFSSAITEQQKSRDKIVTEDTSFGDSCENRKSKKRKINDDIDTASNIESGKKRKRNKTPKQKVVELEVSKSEIRTGESGIGSGKSEIRKGESEIGIGESQIGIGDNETLSEQSNKKKRKRKKQKKNSPFLAEGNSKPNKNSCVLPESGMDPKTGRADHINTAAKFEVGAGVKGVGRSGCGSGGGGGGCGGGGDNRLAAIFLQNSTVNENHDENLVRITNIKKSKGGDDLNRNSKSGCKGDLTDRPQESSVAGSSHKKSGSTEMSDIKESHSDEELFSDADVSIDCICAYLKISY